MNAKVLTRDYLEACCGECRKQAEWRVLSDIPACPEIEWTDCDE